MLLFKNRQSETAQGNIMFVVEVKNGRKIVEKHTFNDFDQAMDVLDKLEAKYYRRYTVEFKDKRYFK